MFVTGPRGAGKTRWLQQQIQDLREKQPDVRCAVLLGEEGRTRMDRFAQDTPGVSVRQFIQPCLCCPALADLPGMLRALAAMIRPDWFFVEVPAITAAGLVAEFDRVLGWPRELVVCLDRAWAAARSEQGLSLFQMVLLELADRVVTDPAGGGVHRDPAARPHNSAPLSTLAFM
ncbi:MAG: GTP-binding protein [Opitutaceae bacterium]|nr:GTP-binding protein [Opitutaceae bacterium]